jgi:hypothetical protein
MDRVHALQHLAPRTPPWRARLAAAVMSAILSVPAVADAHPLEELLAMPFERLLQLQITERRAEWAAVAGWRDDVITRGAP